MWELLTIHLDIAFFSPKTKKQNDGRNGIGEINCDTKLKYNKYLAQVSAVQMSHKKSINCRHRNIANDILFEQIDREKEENTKYH